jgi:hypothetical protein
MNEKLGNKASSLKDPPASLVKYYIYNDVREGIPSGRMNRDVMPHGIVSQEKNS